MLNRWVILAEFLLALALGAIFYALPSDWPKAPIGVGGAALAVVALLSLLLLARRPSSSEGPKVEVETVTQTGQGSVQVTGEHNTVNITINPAPGAPAPTLEEAPMESPVGKRTPRSADETEAVVRERPHGWEYLAFAGWLVAFRDAVEPRYLDHQARYAEPTGEVVEDSEAFEFIQRFINDAYGMVGAFERLLASEVVERAFGVPGAPGDPAKIQHLARRLTSAYEGLVDWSARLRGANRGTAFRELFERLAGLMDRPIEQYRDFVDDFARELDAVPAKLAAGETIQLSFTLTLSIEESDADALSAEIRRLEQAIANVSSISYSGWMT